MKRMMLLLTLVLMSFGCNFVDDDKDCDNQPGCESVCIPCHGDGTAKVYSGEFPRPGIFGAPLHYLICTPSIDQMAADHVCFQDTGHPEDGVQPLCFYGCDDSVCDRPASG